MAKGILLGTWGLAEAVEHNGPRPFAQPRRESEGRPYNVLGGVCEASRGRDKIKGQTVRDCVKEGRGRAQERMKTNGILYSWK